MLRIHLKSSHYDTNINYTNVCIITILVEEFKEKSSQDHKKKKEKKR